jgi:hypothetical protein
MNPSFRDILTLCREQLIYSLLGFKFSQSLSYFIQVLKGIEAASSHEETAVKFSEMKEETLLEMERAHRGGKLTAEYDSHVQLVELAIIQTDW